MVAPLARRPVGPSARLWNAARRGRCAVAAALIVAHGAWSQAACGGDEAEPASERAVGRVELPAGVPLQPSDLQILGAQAQVEVAGDGGEASAHVKIIEAPNSCDVTLVPSATFDAWWNGAPACELGPGRWMIDPDTIAGCITTYRCGGTEHGLAWLPYENTVTIYWRLYDAAGEQVAASNCGGWGGTPTEEDPHASCDYALERTHTVYANTDTWCPGQGIIQAPDGRGSVAFSAMKLAGACDIPEFLVPPPYDGEIDFRFVNCDDPRWRTSVSVCAVLPAR